MVTCHMFKMKMHWSLGSCFMFCHEMSVFFFGHTILDSKVSILDVQLLINFTQKKLGYEKGLLDFLGFQISLLAPKVPWIQYWIHTLITWTNNCLPLVWFLLCFYRWSWLLPRTGKNRETGKNLAVLIQIIAIMIHFWLSSLPEMKNLNDFGLFIKLFLLLHMGKTRFRGILMLIKRSWLEIFSLSKVSIYMITFNLKT